MEGMADRLKYATSPYLLQHADNPVDWWPWGDGAFAEARARDVPVLLSVGYSACHWCHVMAHESFEDPATAALMNENFVAIKVDREERPDVDAVYMTATQAMTGQGGWPMTVFMTPDREPFFCGTYFPRTHFQRLVLGVAEAWRERRGEVTGQAREIAQALAERAAPLRGLAGGHGAQELAGGGAIRRSPCSPGTTTRWPAASAGRPSSRRRWCWSSCCATRERRRRPAGPALRMAAGTLEAMARGGIYDQLGGGFARYSTDAGWVVPHFEKMLYDNALLARVYAHLWRRTGSALGRRVAAETCDLLVRELSTRRGRVRVRAGRGQRRRRGADLRLDAGRAGRGARDRGRCVGGGAAFGVTGLRHLRARPLRPAAAHRPGGRGPAEPDPGRAAGGSGSAGCRRAATTRWSRRGTAWRSRRSRRPGCCSGSRSSIAAAERAASLLARVHLRDGRLARTSRDGAASGTAGVLEDYACVAEGFLALSGVTGQDRWVSLAGQLLDVALARFADGKAGSTTPPMTARPWSTGRRTRRTARPRRVRSRRPGRCSATPR